MKALDFKQLAKREGGGWWTPKRQEYVNGFSCTALGISMALSLATAPATFGASLAATGIMFTSFAVCVGTLPEN
jgi:hypothetical protein